MNQEEKICKRIMKKTIPLFEEWKIKENKGKIVETSEYDEPTIYGTWKDLLENWKDSIKVDFDNGLYYLSPLEYAYLGLDIGEMDYE